MKLAAAALILCLIPPQDAKTSKDPDERRVTLQADNYPMGKVIADLQKETGIPIEFDTDALKKFQADNTTVSFLVSDIVLSGAVKLLLQPHGFKVVTLDKKKILVTIP